MDEVSLRLIIGAIFAVFIAILLVCISMYKRKQKKKPYIVDFGQIYLRNCFCTFVPVVILSYELKYFLLFQGCLLLASIINAKYVDSKIEQQKL